MDGWRLTRTSMWKRGGAYLWGAMRIHPGVVLLLLALRRTDRRSRPTVTLRPFWGSCQMFSQWGRRRCISAFGSPASPEHAQVLRVGVVWPPLLPHLPLYALFVAAMLELTRLSSETMSRIKRAEPCCFTNIKNALRSPPCHQISFLGDALEPEVNHNPRLQAG